MYVYKTHATTARYSLATLISTLCCVINDYETARSGNPIRSANKIFSNKVSVEL